VITRSEGKGGSAQFSAGESARGVGGELATHEWGSTGETLSANTNCPSFHSLVLLTLHQRSALAFGFLVHCVSCDLLPPSSSASSSPLNKLSFSSSSSSSSRALRLPTFCLRYGRSNPRSSSYQGSAVAFGVLLLLHCISLLLSSLR